MSGGRSGPVLCLGLALLKTGEKETEKTSFTVRGHAEEGLSGIITCRFASA